MGRKKKRRGGKSITRTAFKMVRLAALAAPSIHEILLHGSDYKAGIGGAVGLMTGFDLNEGNFRIERLSRGWGPYVMACLATYGIPKLTSIIRRL